MKNELMQALLADDELISLIGKIENSQMPSIFFNSPLLRCEFPAVSFFEKGGGDAVYADDVCIIRTVVMQIDVWAEQGLEEVWERVLCVLRMLGYRLESVCDIPDPNIGHIQIVCSKMV